MSEEIKKLSKGEKRESKPKRARDLPATQRGLLTWARDKDFVRPDIVDLYDSGATLDEADREVTRLFPNLGVGESTYRKDAYAFIRARNEILSTSKVAISIARDRRHLRDERTGLMFERREPQRESRYRTFGKYLAETLLNERPDIKPIVPGKLWSGGTVRYVLSDLHYRGSVDSEYVRNVFGLVLADILENKYSDIRLVLLGDDIEGELHINSRLNDNEGIIRATRKLSDIYLDFVEELYKLPTTTKIFFIERSNHGQIRINGAKRDDFPDADIGSIFGGQITRLVKRLGNRVKYFPSDEQGKIVDGKFIYLHGHQRFASKNGIEKGIHRIARTIPIVDQAASNPNNDLIVVMGHWHEFYNRDAGFGKIVIAPALKHWAGSFERNHAYSINPRFLKIVGDNAEKITEISVGHLVPKSPQPDTDSKYNHIRTRKGRRK